LLLGVVLLAGSWFTGGVFGLSGGPPAPGRSYELKPTPVASPQEDSVLQTWKETQPLTEHIGVRVTLDEKARLQEDAALASLSVSELVRRRSFGRPVIAQADQVMVRELRRIGELLKRLQEESDGAQRQQTTEVLSTLAAAIERLRHDRQKD
jgi:hypothetical protein